MKLNDGKSLELTAGPPGHQLAPARRLSVSTPIFGQAHFHLTQFINDYQIASKIITEHVIPAEARPALALPGLDWIWRRVFLVLFSSYPSRLPLSSLPLHRLSLSPILGPILGYSPPSRSFSSSSSSLVAPIRFSSPVHRLFSSTNGTLRNTMQP